MMRFFALLSLASLAMTAPTPFITRPHKLQRRLIENTPWYISSIKLVEYLPGKDDTLSFRFCDVNEGLELETECARVAENVADSSWIECANDVVAFLFDGTSLQVQRNYIDPR